MGFTNKLEGDLLNHVFAGATLSLPTSGSGNYHVALHVGGSAPNMATGSGFIEPTGGSYGRVTLQRSSTGFNNAATEGAGMAITNKAVVTFTKATADWGTATHFGIYDAATGGNLLVVGALAVSKQILNGDTASFAGGALKIILE